MNAPGGAEASRTVGGGLFRPLWGLTWLAAAMSLAGFVGWWWPLELFAHFRAQYTAAFALAALALLLLRRPWHALLPVALLLVNGLCLLPYYLPSPKPAANSAAQLRVMSLNVYTDNRDYQATLDAVKRQQPDVVLFAEVDPPWCDALEALAAEYPHYHVVPQQGNFGIACYSKVPFEPVPVVWIEGAPTLVVPLDTPAGRVTLIGTHTFPPVRPAAAAGRNRQFAALAETVRAIDGAKLLVGDLNATAWSPKLVELLQATGLHEARLGFGVSPTWPVHNRLMWIPIDHVLVSPEIMVRDFQVGPGVGSDHFPITADLTLP